MSVKELNKVRLGPRSDSHSSNPDYNSSDTESAESEEEGGADIDYVVGTSLLCCQLCGPGQGGETGKAVGREMVDAREGVGRDG
jgi:hypothetical protein